MRETTLGANQWLSDNHRLNFDTNVNLEDLWDTDKNYQTWAKNKWNQNMKHREPQTSHHRSENLDELLIVLSPMQIRTFIFDIDNKF